MKQDVRVVVTKRMVQEALLRLLEQKPLDRIKVSELCRESAINRATFYRHYETLQDVLQEIEMDLIQRMPCPEHTPVEPEDVHRYLERVCWYMYDQAKVLTILFQNCTEDELTRNMTKFYQDFLVSHQIVGEIERPDEDTLQIVAALWAGGFQCLTKKWIMGEIRKTPAELAKILCNVHQLHAALVAL